MNVQVEGLRAFSRSLRSVAPDLAKAQRSVHREYAVRVRDTARQNAMRLKGKRRFAALFTSSSGQAFAALKYRGSKHDAAGGWLFGSYSLRRFERYTRPSKGPHNDGFGQFGADALAASDAIRSETPRMVETYHRDVTRAIERAWHDRRK